MQKLRFQLVFVLFSLCLLLFACRPVSALPVTPSSSPTSVPTITPQPSPTPILSMGFRGISGQRGIYESNADAEWMISTAGPVFSSPVIDGQSVYFGSLGGTFYKVNLADGTEQWTFQAPTAIAATAVVLGNRVYFGTGNIEGDLKENGFFYALDTNSGDKVWELKLPAQIISSPVIVENTAYFGVMDGELYAVDIETGKPKWTFQAQEAVVTTPFIFGHLIYIADMKGVVYAIDRLTGERKWIYIASTMIESSPTVGDGTLYLVDMNGTLYALDAKTGKMQWQLKGQVPVLSSPIYLDGVLFGADLQGGFIAVDTRAQKPLWQFTAGDGILSSPTIKDGVVYFGSADGHLYGLDIKTGQMVFNFTTEGEILSSPAVTGDLVLFSSFDQRFYAVNRTKPVLALAPTPTARPIDPTPTPLPESTVTVSTGTDGLPWWNDRVFYEVFVRSFYDSDSNGIGDLQGLIQKLDYLNDGDPNTHDDLGITGIWLMPVAESPSYHGYDVTDYKKIEQDYGTNADFQQLIKEAHKRGIAVIVDLVMNHTSNQNPWFVEAQIPGSEKENWYLWTTERQNYASPWGSQVWYRLGMRYYYALFWEGMPDLNYNNGAVTNAMFDIIQFWLKDMQVDGFRLDAVRHLIEEGEVQANTPETHLWLQNFHNYVRSVAPNALTVGEVWDKTSEIVPYVGDQVDLAFEFNLATAILDSDWRENNTELISTQQTILDSYQQGQYAAFLTNHDQNRSMNELRNSDSSAKVAATLLLTNPGVPFIYYGEEVGMRGAKPDERIRTPMQWDGTQTTGGFTTGQPWEEMDPGYQQRNVAVETSDPASLLSHYRNLIQLRTAHSALRGGEMTLVETQNSAIYSFIRFDAKEKLLVVVNLSEDDVSDYALTLASGPFASQTRASLLLGEGQLSSPKINSKGGFENYVPLPTLPPKASVVIQLSP